MPPRLAPRRRKKGHTHVPERPVDLTPALRYWQGRGHRPNGRWLPSGGEGLSGTGPKAGGPHYLQRFAVERTVTVNTAAAGGNAALLAQAD